MRNALVVSLGLALALSFIPLVSASPRPVAAFAQVSEDDPESEDFSPEQLDNLLAPIALYPDPLLAQVLLAATFVDEVDEAARYVRAYGQRGVDDQDWDVSVRAVAHYPVVLDYLADKIDWTTSVGQAYVAQSTDVMSSIQRLRKMARSEGNLESTSEQEVFLEDDYIRIVPANPMYIYVPRYSSSIYYDRPQSGLAMSFGAGFAIGAWLNDDFDWRGHRVYYHGWSGGGWIGRSRSRVHVTNVYVNPRFSNLGVNRRVVDRHVNPLSLNRYNTIHREVTYDRSRGRRGEGWTNDNRARRGNAVINRNMDTRDPRLDRNRGREDQGRPRAEVQVAPERRPVAPAPEPVREVRPLSRLLPGLRPFRRNEGDVDPGAASRRGQASREAAKAPPEAARRGPFRRDDSEKAAPPRLLPGNLRLRDRDKKK